MTIGRDQLRALAVLRNWIGELEGLAVLEREGSRRRVTVNLSLGWPPAAFPGHPRPDGGADLRGLRLL